MSPSFFHAPIKLLQLPFHLAKEGGSMAIEYRHSHGLANLTIAPWFDSNDCVSNKRDRIGHALSDGRHSRELRVPDGHELE